MAVVAGRWIRVPGTRPGPCRRCRLRATTAVDGAVGRRRLAGLRGAASPGRAAATRRSVVAVPGRAASHPAMSTPGARPEPGMPGRVTLTPAPRIPTMCPGTGARARTPPAAGEAAIRWARAAKGPAATPNHLAAATGRTSTRTLRPACWTPPAASSGVAAVRAAGRPVSARKAGSAIARAGTCGDRVSPPISGAVAVMTMPGQPAAMAIRRTRVGAARTGSRECPAPPVSIPEPGTATSRPLGSMVPDQPGRVQGGGTATTTKPGSTAAGRPVQPRGVGPGAVTARGLGAMVPGQAGRVRGRTATTTRVAGIATTRVRAAGSSTG